ncbi:MAG TPA: sensor histidine kinase KdpD [Actinomycetota bacterium]|nr:sensor histidine kinase KdpD [Actinomycetota bacterium]
MSGADGITEAPERGTESVEALVGHEVVPEPTTAPAWTHEAAIAAKAAPLRIYLGSAPGVGKTYAMLSEGLRRAERGTKVLVASVETYGRPKTIEMLEGLRMVPPRFVEYRGRLFEEMDAVQVLERHPDVALVDELAHTNVPGAGRTKRWEDVIDLLQAGIEVITTVNVQHIESLNDVVADVTGIRQRETVPDWVVDMADQVELVDMSPHALRRRMLHGNVYPDQRKAELALQRFFTTENLTALRELALMRVANQVDETLLSRWSKGRIPETRERVLVCVTPRGSSEDLVRRGARVAQRARGDLIVVHVRERDDARTREWLTAMDRLTQDLGGELEVIDADDPVEGVLGLAYRQYVTQLVIGEPLRSRWQEMVRGSFVNRLIRKADNIDIHIIARRER